MAASQPCDEAPMTRPTNVLFILSDEHTRRVLGSYGNRIVRTPHLDALATRGTCFASAYCQTPICVPSRGSLATGRWPHAIDSWDNATPYVGTEVSSLRLEREPPRHNTSEHRDSYESREENKHLFDGLALVAITLSLRSYLDAVVVQDGRRIPRQENRSGGTAGRSERQGFLTR